MTPEDEAERWWAKLRPEVRVLIWRQHTGQPSVPQVVTGPNQLVRATDPAHAREAAQAYEPTRESKKGIVLAYLRDRPGTWVSVSEVREIGGEAGDRRCRELKAAGHPLEIRRVAGSNTWQWRWVAPSPVTLW